jgi:Na+-transporting NADH:ubiquinone oxidoreductase subunit NqrB
MTFDRRFLAPVLITCILVVGQWTSGFLESGSRTTIAILIAIGVEALLGRIFTGRWPHLASAYVSGISVGILVRSPEFWPYALCSALAISSKYLIRVDDRHLWNPSNFSIVALLVLAPDVVASLSVQWGNHLWAMIPVWGVGALVLSSLGRLHITATYVTAFVVLAAGRALLTGDPWMAEVAPITGPMYQLFACFMVTDPKSTVRTARGQMLVVMLVAVCEAGLRLAEVVHAPYYALFLVGPAAVGMEIVRDRFRRAAVVEGVA